jgi:dolichol-phosphate mannosyltransferase
MSNNSTTLSIIIPVYNEEKTIIESITRVINSNIKAYKEIVIINDGSTDRTKGVITNWLSSLKPSPKYKLIFRSKKNEGKGSAVRLGIKNSTGDIVIIQDADLEYDPNDYQQCIQPIIEGKCKVVYGSRELNNKNRTYSYFSFYLGGLTLTYWINLLYGADLTDEPTCYKTFDGQIIRSILFKGNGFDWEPEITGKLCRLGYKIEEVPISYTPRNIHEGKKINWKDGIIALWVAFIWSFLPINRERKLLLACPKEKPGILRLRRCNLILISIFILAFGVRFFAAIPGLDNPKNTFYRPDSSSYIEPAKSLLNTGDYNINLTSNKPATLRTPGYPAFIALLLKISNNNYNFCVVVMCLIGALTCIPILYAGKIIGGWSVGLIAALLFSFNITSIASSPLFLSDTLFTFFIAFQLYFFMRFYYSKILLYLFISIIIAALAVYIRPINFLWIFVAIFLVCIIKNLSVKKKVLASISCFIIFFIILFPWMQRNKHIGIGWKTCSISGDLLFHNGAVLLGKVNNESSEIASEKLRKQVELEFNNNPEKYKIEGERISYKESYFIKLIKKNPLTYLVLHFRPSALLPDAPNLLQNLGYTVGGKGTFSVLNQNGLIAAVKHYFKGQLWLIALISPLLIIVAITYLFFFIQLIVFFINKNWFMIFCALCFIEYYLFLPGPISMPRYHLPALPFICIMSASGIFYIFKLLPDRRKSSEG